MSAHTLVCPKCLSVDVDQYDLSVSRFCRCHLCGHAWMLPLVPILLSRTATHH